MDGWTDGWVEHARAPDILDDMVDGMLDVMVDGMLNVMVDGMLDDSS